MKARKDKTLAQKTKTLLETLESGFPVHRLELLWKNKEVVLEWLNSPAFKQKYANHPYPPLLNPEAVMWESSDPLVAWDLNLPLPPFYTMLISVTAGAGGTAFERFLSLCDVQCFKWWHGHHLAYVENYNILVHKEGIKALIITDFISEDTEKFLHLIDKKLPMLALVRDPILILKTLVNHVRPFKQNPLAMRFNLTCSYESVKPVVAYQSSIDGIPNLPGVIEDCISGLYRRIFYFAKKLSCIAPEVVEYIDVKEISGENAFATFLKLGKKFGFNVPMNAKEKFTYRANKFDGIAPHLPCVLVASEGDLDKQEQDLSSLNAAGGGANLTIIRALEADKTAINCTHLLAPYIDSNLAITTDKAGITLLQKNSKLQRAVKRYLKGYFAMLKAADAEVEKNLKTAQDVLEYLQTHKAERDAIKRILDEELEHIKKHRPDIVASWEYYQKFEAMF